MTIKPALTPARKQYLYQRAHKLYSAGRFAEARRVFGEILKKEPTDAVALHDVGASYFQEGDLALAERYLEKARQAHPDFLLAKLTLAKVFFQRGRTETALDLLRQTSLNHSSNPDQIQLLDLLTNLLISLEQHEQARPLLERLVELQPANPAAFNKMGFCAEACGNLDGAIQYFKRSLELEEEQADIWGRLVDLYKSKRLFPEALTSLDRFKALKPENKFSSHFALGEILEGQLRLSESLAAYETAQETSPHDLATLNRRYRIDCLLLDFDKVDQNTRHIESMIREDPSKAASYLLYMLAQSETISATALYEAHRQFETTLPYRGPPLPTSISRARSGSLRVGFLSGDFKKHPVSQFFLPLLKALKSVGLTCYGYCNTPTSDAVTEVYKTTFDKWQHIRRLSDRAAADRIQEDQLDILIDLSGLTTDNRLDVIPYHPASVTCTYLGYLTTTGLRSMDYWMLDETVFPEFIEELTTEIPYRLKRPWIAYPLPTELPKIPLHPKPPGSPIIFGTANNAFKYSRQSIRLFAKVLHGCPGSKFLMKYHYFSNPDVVKGAIRAFAAEGIDVDRLIVGRYNDSFLEHLHTLQQIDIALDTTPFNGGTTTCDTLVAGVPVLTLAGQRFISRMSATMLHSLELDEWICATEEEYVAKAVLYAMDVEGRMEFRRTIQDRMRSSQLCDVDDLARCMTTAFEDMLAKSSS